MLIVHIIYIVCFTILIWLSSSSCQKNNPKNSTPFEGIWTLDSVEMRTPYLDVPQYSLPQSSVIINDSIIDYGDGVTQYYLRKVDIIDFFYRSGTSQNHPELKSEINWSSDSLSMNIVTDFKSIYVRRVFTKV